ncbi:MAG: hypothetical protein HC923_12470 [Myxococcales bacterium]|nr:hypothetical protein [Myxococcales bacterium]
MESMLASVRQWRMLENVYLDMIRRLPKENKRARIAIWKSLADLYAKVLDDAPGAARALEVVFNLEPSDVAVGLELARLNRRVPERRKDAIAVCQRILHTIPDPSPAVRLIAEAHYEQGQLDDAFCALGGLMLLRAATEEEGRGYRGLLDKAPAWPSGSVSDQQWQQYLLHPANRGPLARLVSVLFRQAPELFSGRRRGVALKKKERVDLADKSRNAAVRLRYFDVWAKVANALGLRDVEHYRRPGSVEPPLLLAGTPKPILYAGEQHEVFKAMPPRQIAWMVGRQMAAVRPELVRSSPSRSATCSRCSRPRSCCSSPRGAASSVRSIRASRRRGSKPCGPSCPRRGGRSSRLRWGPSSRKAACSTWLQYVEGASTLRPGPRSSSREIGSRPPGASGRRTHSSRSRGSAGFRSFCFSRWGPSSRPCERR